MAHLRKSLVAVVTAAGLVLAACGGNTDTSSSASNAASTSDTANSSASSEGTITITDNYGEVTIPANPQAIVSTDNRTFELLDSWGVKLAAAPKALVPATVPNYKNDDSIADLGTHREPNFEALVAAQPDLIIVGQRFDQHYEEIKKLNPDVAVINLEPREGQPMDAELKRQVETLGQIFGKEAEAAQAIADFDAAKERAAAAYNGTDTVLAVNVSGGEIGYVAPSVGRVFGPLYDWLNLTPALEVENSSSNHEGDDVSVETIVNSNPDLLLVLDRDAGTSAGQEEGFKAAEQVIKENQALANTAVLQNNKFYIAPADTYTNESLATYTEILDGFAQLAQQ